MIIISDSPTYLLEKIGFSKGIKNISLKNFPCEIKENDFENTDAVLILITDSFYKLLGLPNQSYKTFKKKSKKIFIQLESIIKILDAMGIWIYLPKLPQHFIYTESDKEYFSESESKDYYINYVNHNLMLISTIYRNFIFLNGI